MDVWRTPWGRVTSLGDPSPRRPVLVASLEVDLLSTSTDVGLEALLQHELANVGIVVAAVKTQPLGCSAEGIGPSNRDRLKRVG
jgi:hypothetical protein